MRFELKLSSAYISYFLQIISFTVVIIFEFPFELHLLPVFQF